MSIKVQADLGSVEIHGTDWDLEFLQVLTVDEARWLIGEIEKAISEAERQAN